MIYLASPYNDKDTDLMQERFHQVCEATAILMLRGAVVYSPIAHNHYLACNFNLPRSWSFWSKFDLPILTLADSLLVLTLPNWENSNGIVAEIAHAITNGLPVSYISLEELRDGKDIQYL